MVGKGYTVGWRKWGELVVNETTHFRILLSSFFVSVARSRISLALSHTSLITAVCSTNTVCVSSIRSPCASLFSKIAWPTHETGDEGVRRWRIIVKQRRVRERIQDQESFVGPVACMSRKIDSRTSTLIVWLCARISTCKDCRRGVDQGGRRKGA